MTFQGRRVLLVGGLGFIGVNLTRRLLQDGAAITVITPVRARHQEDADDFETAGVRIVEADVRDLSRMRQCVDGQDLVFNLSGRSGAVRSMEDPWGDLDLNCAGALSLLEALRVVNPRAKVVFLGSRLEYGRVGTAPVPESLAGEPLCLHAIHKLTIEHYLALYRRLFGIRSVTARLTNPYGPGQPRARTAYGVVNRMIQLALDGQTISIYGDGRQRRDYIYVDDAVEALLALASAEAEGVYNVGTGIGTPIVEMAQTIVAIAGSGRTEHIEWPPLAAQIETGDFVADVSRIASEVGWRPAFNLRDGLSRTIAHYRAQVAS